MIYYIFIVGLLFMTLTALGVNATYSKDQYKKTLLAELEEVETIKSWKFYLFRAIEWFIDLNVIVVFIAALVQFAH